MDDLYSIHPGLASHGSVRGATSDASEICDGRTGAPDLTDLVKAQIARHPRYPSLLSAYIECRKVGAPPEMATLLEEIGREKHAAAGGGGSCAEMGADPELDEFMESYCRALVQYKEELSRPFDEAASFLSSIEAQLRNLCGDYTSTSASVVTAAANSLSDEAAGSSEEEPSCGDVDASDVQECGSSFGDQELKGMLLKKYSGYLSSLKKEFMKKRKRGKLPKDARVALLDWWNNHYRWPYPTEEEKAQLAEMTGLDQKQINNWFINQRKRHWKPSSDMQYALMQGVSRGSSSGTMLYFDTGTIGP